MAEWSKTSLSHALCGGSNPSSTEFLLMHYFCGYVLNCDTGNGIEGQTCVVEVVKMNPPKIPKVTEGCGIDPLRGPFLKKTLFSCGDIPNETK